MTKFAKDVVISDVEKRRLPTKHYVYVLKVSWSDGKINLIYRRYSQFFALQASLIDTFPEESGVSDPARRILPFLPGKILFGRSQIREVALKRKDLLHEYLQNLIKLPEKISRCDFVLEFLMVTVEDINGSIGKNDNNVLKTCDSISEPIVLEKYTVIANWSSTERNQISLAAGDVVEVFEKHDNGWWFVCLDDEQGWAPSSYLEPIDGTREDEKGFVVVEEEKFICTQDFVASLPDELSLKLGDIVFVLVKQRDGWWKVKLKYGTNNAKEGLAPVTHLSKFIKECEDSDIPKPVKKKSFEAPPRQSTVKKSKRLVGGKSDRKPGDQTAQTEEDTDDEVIYVCGKSYKSEDGSFKIKEGTKITIVEKAPNGWWRVLADGLEGWVPSSVAHRKRQRKSFEVNGGENLYVTVSSYEGTEEGEISFEANVTVEVIEENENGWWFIKVDNSEGWAPSTYLKKYEHKKIVSKMADIGRAKSLDNMIIEVRDADTPYENVVTQIPNKPPVAQKPSVSPKPRVAAPKPAPRQSALQQGEKNKLSPPVMKQKPTTPEPARKMRGDAPTEKAKVNAKTSGYDSVPKRGSYMNVGFGDSGTGGEVYVTLADYSDRDDSMLSFKAGQQLLISQKNENGWWFAKRGDESGWVPSNYLKQW